MVHCQNLVQSFLHLVHPLRRYVCNYLVHGGDREEFFRTFHPSAMSRGFDPDTDLKRVGLANQTTMLKVRARGLQGMGLNSAKSAGRTQGSRLCF